MGFIFIAVFHHLNTFLIKNINMDPSKYKLNSNVPDGPLKDKWNNHKNTIKLVNPANKRNIDIIVVGTGLAGGSASATLAELGYT